MTVTLRVRQATTFISRLKGLLGMKEFPLGVDALLLSPCNAIHTVGMGFAIDLVFLDSHNKVIRVVKNIFPGKLYVSEPGARSVLEMAAGHSSYINLCDTIITNTFQEDAS
ncbi:MAG: DUF192 domain-containing protein [Coriobacteriia bacterium]|nr:DUF192 domain-containing protein [Coriobacteriia bacterium]